MSKSVLTVALAAIVFTPGCDPETAAAWNSSLTRMSAELNQSGFVGYGSTGNSYNTYASVPPAASGPSYASAPPAASVPGSDTGKPYKYQEFEVQMPDTSCDHMTAQAYHDCMDRLHPPSSPHSSSPSSGEQHVGEAISQ